jgi:putative SOS response-associated peptidase YedK
VKLTSAARIIIVTDADALTEPIHVRMPVVLDKANTWLAARSAPSF